MILRLLYASLLLKVAISSDKSICYNSLIFSDQKHCYSDQSPFHDVPLPESPEDIAPIYHLLEFDKKANKTSSRIINNSHELSNDDGNLVILVHGWMNTFDNTKDWHDEISKNLFQLAPDIHILFVEWAKGAAFHVSLNPYAQPSSNTRVIGDCLADFILANPKLDASKIHCIGFSLGAHVCSFFAKRYISLGVRIARISALDPADMHFNKNDPFARLDKEDAHFVDVLHTSRLGLERPVGTIDFYVNNAKWQPGCMMISRVRRQVEASPALDVMTNPIDDIGDAIACSHHRAPVLFAQSIVHRPDKPSSNCTFNYFCPCSSLHDFTKGLCKHKCPNATPMGYWSYVSGNFGSFYGATTAKAPFCID